MTASELCYLSAHEAIERFRARTLSPVELVEALIERHGEVGARINATAILYHERALKLARKAEERYARPGARLRRLEGVPVMIKDLHPIEGELNPQSCRIFARGRRHRYPAYSRASAARRGHPPGALDELRARHPHRVHRRPVGSHTQSLESRDESRRILRRIRRRARCRNDADR